ncbi:tail fiber assembly protein [Enterobacter asburiae]|uniref:tail fiber assembly protein n=1 Tax=Enterobacter asburiae TaxID=61645 RepID=UPI0015E9C7A2|nr:tail fiber assembly protein [Enterobacter asburiae]QLR29171.1 tail fiber assembly protein [Enterobacter asburiae]
MNNNYVFSATTIAFYPVAMMDMYKDAGTWPADAVPVSDDIYDEFLTTPEGKKRGAKNGLPCWLYIPPPTHAQLVITAEVEKQNRIDRANDYMNSKQWPGKAAIGRLKGDELTHYNRWLDYLDALEAVNTYSTPDITWPVPPEM